MQKTAYEMRISDWSSDVCSSDLRTKVSLAQARATIDGDFGVVSPLGTDPIAFAVGGEYREYAASQASDTLEIGRASWRGACVSTCRSRWSPYHYKKTPKMFKSQHSIQKYTCTLYNQLETLF